MEIDIQEEAAAVIDQLWPTGSNIMITAFDIMKPLLDLTGVSVTHLSPFCRYFDAPKDLMKAYIEYCQMTFKHGPISVTNEEFGEVDIRKGHL